MIKSYRIREKRQKLNNERCSYVISFFGDFSFLLAIRNWMETNWIATRLRKYIEYVFLGTNARNVIAFNYITSEDLRVYPRNSCVCVCVCSRQLSRDKTNRAVFANKLYNARNFRSYAYLLVLSSIIRRGIRRSML